MVSRLLSRSEIGLRPWVCFPTNMKVEGLTLHYPGPSPWNTSRSVGGKGIDRSSPERFAATADHRYCTAIWRGNQAYHMDARAGCDIFYDGGTCPHGVRLAARPRNMRSGAQGTNDGNYRSKGIQYVGGLASNGQLDPLTDEARLAFHDWAADLGWPLRWGHRDWKSTSCPGGDVYTWRQAGFPRPAAPTPPEDDLTPEQAADLAWIKDRIGHTHNYAKYARQKVDELEVKADVLETKVNDLAARLETTPEAVWRTLINSDYGDARTTLRDTRTIARRTEQAVEALGGDAPPS